MLKCWGLATSRFKSPAPDQQRVGCIQPRRHHPVTESPPSTKHFKDPGCVLRGGTHQPQCCLHKPEAALLRLHPGTSQPSSQIPMKALFTCCTSPPPPSCLSSGPGEISVTQHPPGAQFRQIQPFFNLFSLYLYQIQLSTSFWLRTLG